MDKLRPILEQLKKYLFWELCVVVLVSSIVGWFMASGAVSALTATKVSAVKGAFDTVQGLSLPAPNEDWKKEVDAVVEKNSNDVFQVWESIYKRQRDLFVWPDVFSATEQFSQLELWGEIPSGLREVYQNESKKVFDELAKFVGAKVLVGDAVQAKGSVGGRPYPSAALGPGPGLGGARVRPTTDPADVDEGAIVQWDSTSQFSIHKFFLWDKLPTSEEVWQRQENYWVCRNLLGIVAKINEGATANYNAPIKVIRDLQIGRDGLEAIINNYNRANPVVELQPLMVAGAGPSVNVLTRKQKTITVGTQSGAVADPKALLRLGRYCDENLDQLPIDKDPSLDQMKRMPVVMKLTIDQSRITDLLAACADAPIPFEVHQIALTVGGETIVDKGGTPMVPGLTQSIDVKDFMLKDAVIELYGLVSIYNPPDKTKLKQAVEAPAAPTQ